MKMVNPIWYLILFSQTNQVFIDHSMQMDYEVGEVCNRNMKGGSKLKCSLFSVQTLLHGKQNVSTHFKNDGS
jgi:hypothetical protein